MFPFYNFVTRKLYNFVYFDFHMAVKIEIPVMKYLILLPTLYTKDYRFKCGRYWTVKIHKIRQGLAGPARKVFFKKFEKFWMDCLALILTNSSVDEMKRYVQIWLTKKNFARKIPSFT